MLPDHITTETIREISDVVDGRDPDLLERTDDPLVVHIEAVISEIAEQLNLNAEQVEELEERICWRLELLPPSS